MDELTAISVRLVGEPELAARCAAQATQADGRLAQWRAVLAACRSVPTPTPSPPEPPPGDLRATVAAELRAAVATLPWRAREALALRDVGGVSHAEMAELLGLEAADVVGVLVAARVDMWAALRNAAPADDPCPERDRAARTVTLRLDREPVSAGDEDWLVEHLGRCPGCSALHATLLEAAACYRGWPDAPSEPAPLAAAS